MALNPFDGLDAQFHPGLVPIREFCFTQTPRKVAGSKMSSP
jgi:hypothetical protein